MTASLHRRLASARRICASYCAQRHNRHCACIVKNFTLHNLSKKPTNILTFPKNCEWKTCKYHQTCPGPVHIFINCLPWILFFNITLRYTHFNAPNLTAFTHYLFWSPPNVSTLSQWGGGGLCASMNLQTMPVELHIPGRASQARQAVTEKPD